MLRIFLANRNVNYAEDLLQENEKLMREVDEITGMRRELRGQGAPIFREFFNTIFAYSSIAKVMLIESNEWRWHGKGKHIQG